MASPRSLKRTFEAANLHGNDNAPRESLHITALATPVEGHILSSNSRPSTPVSQRGSSPLSPAGSLGSTTPGSFLAPPLLPVADDGMAAAPKKRKLTFAEKEAQRIEKQFRDLQRAEDRAKKEEEKRLKEELKKLKLEEQEEKKRARDAEKAAKDLDRLRKEEEKRKKEADKAAKEAVKEADRTAREEEKSKKERSQLKLGAFFAKPALSAGGSATSSRRPSAASIASIEDAIIDRDTSEVPHKSASEYESAFPPFFVHSHTTLAPVNRFTHDTESLQYAFDIIESAFGLGAAPKAVPSLHETMSTPTLKRQKLYHPPVAVSTIMDEVTGSVVKPIDLTQDSSLRKAKTPLDFLREVPIKYLKFREDVRPPYMGTFTRPLPFTTAMKLSRNPFSRALPSTDYDYDSEAEWEEPEEGEDLDSEGEEEPDEDDEEDMEGFLDDEDDSGLPKRRNIMGDVEPQCTAMLWQDEMSDDSLRGVPCGTTTINLTDFSIESTIAGVKFPIEPYSVAYWPSKTMAKPIPAPAPAMAPPRTPLNPITHTNGTILPPQSALDLLTKPSLTQSRPKSSGPTKPISPDLLQEFRRAVDGSDLTKTGLIEVLKKRFPGLRKNTVQDTLAQIAQRVGKKEAEKKWVLL